MSDDARPENTGSQREVDALSGLPEDSRVHLEDIEWPELDWSDSDEVPPTPPRPVLRLVVSEPSTTSEAGTDRASEPSPALPGPRFNGKDGSDWRPAVPFWLRMPEPEPEQQDTAPDGPTDWRPAVPFWLRMPEPAEPVIDEAPADQAAPAPQPTGNGQHQVLDEAELEADELPTTATSATEPAEAIASPDEPTERDEPSSDADTAPEGVGTATVGETADDLDDLLPDEDLTPLPGTTGEAVFFPPSTSRGIVPISASAASPGPAPSTQEAAPARPATASRSGAGSATVGRTSAPRSSDAPFSTPSAPYAQYDTPEPDWERRGGNGTWAERDGESAPAEPWTPPVRPVREPQPAPPNRRWLIRGAVIGAAISTLVVSLVAVLAIQGRFNSVNGTMIGAPVGSPEETVSGYLNALAHSDSQQALGFAKLRPADQRMLTDEVLSTSNKSAPLRQVSVHTTELTDYRAQVEATYLIGGQKVIQSFTVYAVGTEWKLYDVARKVDLTQLKTGDLPLTLNGVAVPTENVELFPGRYQVATTDSRYQVTDDAFVVTSPGVAPELGTVRLGLSASGIDEIISAANTRLHSCLAARELQPAGCGFGAVAPRGTKVQLDTVRWKVRKGPSTLTLLRPTLDRSDPRLATADVAIQVAITAKDSKGGSLGVADTITTVIADLSSDSVRITFD